MASYLEKQLTSTFQHQNATILPSCLKPLKHFVGADIKGNLTHTCTCTHWTERMKTSTEKITVAAGPKALSKIDPGRESSSLQRTEGAGCAMMLPRKTYAAES